MQSISDKKLLKQHWHENLVTILYNCIYIHIYIYNIVLEVGGFPYTYMHGQNVFQLKSILYFKAVTFIKTSTK